MTSRCNQVLWVMIISGSLIMFSSCTGCGGEDLRYSGSKTKVSKEETASSPAPKPEADNVRSREREDDADAIVVPMKHEGGVYVIPVKINGTEMDFIFDTGAGMISISALEAKYLLKQGKISENDVVDQAKFIDAQGNVSVGTIINLKSVTIGSRTIHDVQASIVDNERAPLLLGQSALEKFGSVSIDYKNGNVILR